MVCCISTLDQSPSAKEAKRKSANRRQEKPLNHSHSDRVSLIAAIVGRTFSVCRRQRSQLYTETSFITSPYPSNEFDPRHARRPVDVSTDGSPSIESRAVQRSIGRQGNRGLPSGTSKRTGPRSESGRRWSMVMSTGRVNRSTTASPGDPQGDDGHGAVRAVMVGRSVGADDQHTLLCFHQLSILIYCLVSIHKIPNGSYT